MLDEDRFDAGILGVFQGKSAKCGGKRFAGGRFDNFQTSPRKIPVQKVKERDERHLVSNTDENKI